MRFFLLCLWIALQTPASELTDTEIPAVSFSFYIQPPWFEKRKLTINKLAPDKLITATLHKVNYVKQMLELLGIKMVVKSNY